MTDQNNTTGVLVMNRENARFFQYKTEEDEREFTELEDFHSEKSHLPDNREHFRIQKEGEGFVNLGEVEEAHRIREHDVEVFTKEVAEKLWKMFQHKDFEELILIIPKKVENELVRHFHTELKDIIKTSVDANLVGMSWQEILERVKDELK